MYRSKSPIAKWIRNWATATYPKTKYWEGVHAFRIKAIFVLLSLVYAGVLAAYLIFAESKVAALLLMAFFVFIGMKPLRGLAVSIGLATFQKGIGFLGFLNFPVFAVCFSITMLLWIYREAIHLKRFRRTRLDIWVLLFFSITVISTLIHMQAPTFADKETLYPILQLVSLSMVIGIFMFARELLDTRREISYIILSIMLAGILVSLIGFIDANFGLNLFNNDYIKPFKEILGYKLGVDRIMSTFDNPNLLGMYLLYILPLCFYLAYDENEWPKKWMMAIVSAFLLYILWLTQDFSSWIALSYGIGLILTINIYRFVRKWYVIAAIMMFVSLGTFLFLSDTTRWEGRFHILWPTAIKIFGENPWLGVGMGNYYAHYKQLSAFDWNFAFHAHNLYLQVLAERGIFAFIFFGGILATFLISKLKHLVLKAKSNYLVTSLLLAVIATLVSGLMQYSFSWIGLEMHFWLYLLITIGVIEKHIRLDI
ncbi:O-antigen ligase family protein [Candidatus Woesearchaeota archaeon]|nr:O-antigen ligase family protein [Candidatus Woesearchaeota archaeon]MBI2661092.1 O-antigen ligase family protein [Candidatus Woesearchaeota archaeon]